MQSTVKQSGVVLVFSLMLLALLSLMAAGFSHGMRNDATLIAHNKNRIQSRAVADAGIAYAQFMLAQVDVARRWRADGREYAVTFEGHSMQVSILDEAGKFDLNRIGQDQLLTLLRPVVGTSLEADQLVDRILDWRDADDEPRQYGAERMLGVDRSYFPANRAFQSIGELKRVWGVTEDIYVKLSPWLTVVSRQPKVDVGVAGPQVLSMLPGSDAFWIQQVLDSRNQSSVETAQIPIPDSMTQYAVLRSTQRGRYFSLLVRYPQPDGRIMLSKVLMRRNSHSVFPVFTEIERTLTLDSALTMDMSANPS